ncbi:hypothetical protein Pryu01_01817 [Paraliobacillus ryukyuensis]|uniref:PAS domain S-box-containing protein/diguanylate cyclase (GGDEF)-like protein n=1 Tax=Paraliobacillus ryukyuensis TaxID=200904 RepID=A0A366E7I5_9BACI|nr:sensor domain-containing diguanylate cyclase [Paraliobacillus ryukyuensis]RBO98333.1 PAS domain S-box-containing protein/diguanylate cyclase (GGDEF)-like protein [Paraliobacillus ryukyuensis]
MNDNQLNYLSVYNGIQDMVFVMCVSSDQRYFYYEFINEKTKKITGYTDDIIGKELAEVNSGALLNVLHEKYRKVVMLKQPITYEDSFHARHAGDKVSETTLTPIIVDGKVKQVVALTRDITTLKEAEYEKKISQEKLRFSRQRYKALFDQNPDAIIYLDLDGNITNGNNVFEQLFRIHLDKKTIALLSLIHNPDQTKVSESFLQARDGKTTYVETPILTTTNVEIHLQFKFVPIKVHNTIHGVYAIIKDMTKEHKAKEALIKSEQRFRLIAENSYDLISLLDSNGKIVYASPSYAYILGYPVYYFESHPITNFINKEDQAAVEEKIKQAVTHQLSFTIECRIYNRLNEWLWFEINGQPVFTTDHEFKHLVVVGRDITDRKRYEARLKTLAYHDSLTGLPNRRLFQDRLMQTMATNERNQNRFAIAMLDLDDFKQINDQKGHDVGDAVMQELGKRLEQSVREMDTVARLGGDEFIILLPTIETKANVETVLNRIKAQLQNPWIIEPYHLTITASIGVILSDGKGFSTNYLMKQVDEALYKAKNNGKNSAVIEIHETTN